MKILVTGHEGFVGAHVISGIGLEPGSDVEFATLVDAEGRKLSILNATEVRSCLERSQPDAVIHLAAQSFVPEAWRDPVGTYDVNFTGTHNLLDACKKSGFTGRFLFVSSADVYGGTSESDLPLNETTPALPLNPYAVSKLAAELLCGYWQRAEGIDIVIARAFNHIGPGQSTRFAIADFCKTIAAIRLGKAEPVLHVGDLDITRDFTDVRDVIAAYRLLLQHGRSGEVYNVCSGVERNMRETVNLIAELAGVSVELRQDPARFRKAGQRRACGNPQKLRADTGWQPRIDWTTSLRDTLDHWETTLA